MIEIQAPNKVEVPENHISLFLAGSIEMGSAEPWQQRVIKYFDYLRYITVLNPRRDDWDSTWSQAANNPKFAEQVNWELDGLEYADFVLFYFDPNTKSPITLLELGLTAPLGDEYVLVVCPEGFYRKGNVDIICKRFNIPVYTNLEAALHDFIITRYLPKWKDFLNLK